MVKSATGLIVGLLFTALVVSPAAAAATAQPEARAAANQTIVWTGGDFSPDPGTPISHPAIGGCADFGLTARSAWNQSAAQAVALYSSTNCTGEIVAVLAPGQSVADEFLGFPNALGMFGAKSLRRLT